MNHAFPENPPNIRRLPDDDDESYIDQVRLLTTRLLLHASQMRFFFEQRRQIELAILRSDFGECNKCLGNIESELGRSLWLLKISIAISAIQHGLEAQKNLTQEFIGDRGRSTTSSILHFTSQRNEESTSATRYIARLKNILDKSGLQESAKVHYNFHLTYQVPTEDKATKWLLLHEAQVSLIDTYEAFLSSTLAAAAAQKSNLHSEVLDALDAVSELGDLRAEKLRFISGRVTDRRLKTRDLDGDCCLVAGNRRAGSGHSDEYLRDPRGPWIEAMLRIKSNSEGSGIRTVREDWVVDISTIISKVSQADDAFNSLLKRSLNLDVSVTGLAQLSFATDTLSSDAPLSRLLHDRAPGGGVRVLSSGSVGLVPS